VYFFVDVSQVIGCHECLPLHLSEYFTVSEDILLFVTSVTFCESEVKMKLTFCVAYCYETIIFQYAIVTDRAGVQPIGYRLGPRPRAQACG